MVRRPQLLEAAGDHATGNSARIMSEVGQPLRAAILQVRQLYRKPCARRIASTDAASSDEIGGSSSIRKFSIRRPVAWRISIQRSVSSSTKTRIGSVAMVGGGWAAPSVAAGSCSVQG